jgi:hypothetical protein
MIFYHATHKTNVPSILKYGLRLEFAQCAPEAIWAVLPGAVKEAIAHAARRHGWKPEDMAVIRIEIRGGEFLKKRESSFCFYRHDVHAFCCSLVTLSTSKERKAQ